uniref:Uncharacterized protein n=1 Tax=Anguilla anguilla TaxID=7936 RepID=A0A0E9UXX3_ANGAN
MKDKVAVACAPVCCPVLLLYFQSAVSCLGENLMS